MREFDGVSAGHATATYAVHQNGQYALHASGSHDAVWDAFVIRDDRIGFARTSGGALEAVADGQRMRLPDGSYEWQYVPPPALPARETKKIRAQDVADTVGMALVGTAITCIRERFSMRHTHRRRNTITRP